MPLQQQQKMFVEMSGQHQGLSLLLGVQKATDQIVS